MSDGFDIPDHDRALVMYHAGHVEVWCENPACANHEEGTTVIYEVEWGQTTVTPSECPDCHRSWLFDKPEPSEEEVDE